MPDPDHTNHSKCFKDYEVCTVKFVDRALWIDERNYILRDPFEGNINVEPEPQKITIQMVVLIMIMN